MDANRLALALLTVVAVLAIGAALVALKRLGRRAASEAQVAEDLRDTVWELESSVERHRSLVDAQGDVILRRDAEGRTTFVNEAFAALLGRPRAALIGETIALEILETGTIEHRADGVKAFDARVATAQGPRWLAWQEIPIPGGDGRAGETQIVGTDITDRKAAEAAIAEARDAAEAANRAKSRFLAMVTHELRTPLTGMLGLARLLADTQLTPEQRSYVGSIETSGEALLALVDDILDLAAIEADRLAVEPTAFDLGELMEEVAELLGPRAEAKQLEIATRLMPGVPATIVADRRRLRQILLNLAGNGIKYTASGGVGIRAEMLDGRLRIAVIDTGPGIEAEALGRIFEEFERGSDPAALAAGGAGLGLAIARRLAGLMGGTIGVASTPGAGSTFTVTLTVAAEETAPPPHSARPLAGRRVLVAARSPFEAPWLVERLADDGAEAALVATPAAARAALARASYDTLLIDSDFEAEGDALAAEAAAHAVASRLLLVTPATRSRLGELKARGFTGYLVRPLRASSVAARLAAPAASDAPSPGVAQEGPARIAGRALVAEDDPVNATITRAHLRRLGLEVTIETDGAAAVAAYAQALAEGRGFALVLLDLRLPVLDGLAAARRIRALEAESAAPAAKMLALSANAAAADRRAATAAGMDGFLAKPLDPLRLLAWISADGGRRAG